MSNSQITASDIVNARIRDVMAERGLTQADLAASLGIHQVTVSKRLTTQGRWSVDELTQVAATLEVDLARILPLRQLQWFAS